MRNLFKRSLLASAALLASACSEGKERQKPALFEGDFEFPATPDDAESFAQCIAELYPNLKTPTDAQIESCSKNLVEFFWDARSARVVVYGPGRLRSHWRRKVFFREPENEPEYLGFGIVKYPGFSQGTWPSGQKIVPSDFETSDVDIFCRSINSAQDQLRVGCFLMSDEHLYRINGLQSEIVSLVDSLVELKLDIN